MIAHFDLDSFFASVELLKAPELKGKPVIVGGNRERGIVTTCTYEARKFGVHSAMPMKMAIKLCPQAIVIPGNYNEYSRYSKIVTQIISSRAPLFEKASIDEFYVDLSGMDKFFDALKWTISLRETITRETGLPISFGIGKNKMIAKMATNEAKPNGFLQIPLGKEKEFLAPLSVDKIPGVGAQMNEILNYHGIKLIRDLHQTTPDRMQVLAGNRGIDLWNRAQGGHTSIINTYREAKSISKENTFDENVTDVNFLLAEIVRMVEKISFELRKDEKSAACVAIKIRYPDFTTSSKQVSITATSADEEIIPVARELFHKLYKKGTPVRLLGVKVSELNNEAVQTNLFQDTKRRDGLYKAMDEVKNRFGNTSVFRASGK